MNFKGETNIQSIATSNLENVENMPKKSVLFAVVIHLSAPGLREAEEGDQAGAAGVARAAGWLPDDKVSRRVSDWA